MTQYPQDYDAYPNLDQYQGGNLATQIANLNDAVEAMQRKIGLDPDGQTYFRTDGTPDAAATAELTTSLTGSDNDLVFTSLLYGAAGNAITVEYVDPGENDASLSIEVNGTAIVVNLATDSGGLITSTAAEITTAIEADAAADALVSVANSGGDDGSGVVTALAETALADGVDASKAGLAVVGALLVDYDSGTLYVNTGTQAEPVWTELAAPA